MSFEIVRDPSDRLHQLQPDDWTASEAPDGRRSETLNSRTAIKSFWVGCAGLAIFSHVGILLVVTARFGCERWFVDAFFREFGGRFVWRLMETSEWIWNVCLIPSMIATSVMAILLWRGSLGWRTSISLIIIISSIGLFADWSRGVRRIGDLTDKGIGLIGIVACWLVLPAIFLLAPFSTHARLRMVAGAGLILLSGCINLILMKQFPFNEQVLYWLTFFAAVVAGTTFLRNWGRVATLEADAGAEQIEKTSSGTLLELMAISGLGCATVVSWSTRQLNWRLSISIGVAIALGFSIVYLNLTVIRPWLHRNSFRWPVLLVAWGACGLLFGAFGSIEFVQLYSGPWLSIWKEPHFVNAIACGYAASLVLFGYTTLCAWWLSKCGWRM